MPYLFTCPHCKTATMVDDRYSGQTGRCVTCGREITVPAFRAASNASNASNASKARGAEGWGLGGLRFGGMRAFRWALAGVAAVVIVGAVALVTIRYGSQGIQTLQENRLRGDCIRNLEKIAAAMNAYAEDYGSYPPPVTLAADGTPLHSWRVLVLPYLGYQTLYDEFDLEQPWSSNANRQLIFQMPEEYRSPVASAASGYETYYALVTGPDTLFPPGGPLGPDGVTDDPAKTLLIVEAAQPPSLSLDWTEPGDLDFATMSTTIGSDLGGHHGGGVPGGGSHQASGATAVTVDGRGQWLRETLEPAVVRALVTPRGGEGLPDDVLD
ncbi:DUF1559 family PulG-like putative transporter [Candidatus Laterigemmans baculatus]|uniref:DUF1559 family PulG-like putative transporter n=1 Tax=Candidatus Laterigemmans baculatus TaxID=2770505 RepID=UPI0013DB231C|nr:DUF1559 domain-containing protein [Candidatus Laterigemmans baculatus]